MANLLTLEEWASRTYDTSPSLSPLRCWAREGGFTLRRNLAEKYKRQRDTTTKQALPGESYYHRCAGRQSEVTELDKKYTMKLADAKAENDAVQRKLDNGDRGLVKGKCPVSASTQTAGAASMGDDATVELSSIAGRNVLGIRSGILSDQTALSVLQDNIRTQCLK